MHLIFFAQCASHVCRVARLIQWEAGNVMMVGVGGSGKQSVVRMAAFLRGYEVEQLSVTSSYSLLDLKDDFKKL